MRVTASSSSGSAPGRRRRKTALIADGAGGELAPGELGVGVERGEDATRCPIRSPIVQARRRRSSQTRTVTTGPRVSPHMHERVVGRADQDRRRIEEPGSVTAARRPPAARRPRRRRPAPAGAPTRGGRRRSAARTRSPDRSPARPAAPRACAASASRNSSATAWCTCTRSTDPHDWPGADERARGDQRRPPTRRRRPRRRRPGGCPRPPRPAGSRGRRPGGSTSGRAARSSPCSSCRTSPSSSSSTSICAASGAFSDGLSTTALPVTSDAASAPHEDASGSHHGIRIATTPRGSRTTRSPRGGRARSSGPSSA